MSKSRDIVFDDDNYFGHCRVPKHKNYYLNIGRGHWVVCDKCRIKWFIDANLFSSWRRQTEDAWQANDEKVREYREITS